MQPLGKALVLAFAPILEIPGMGMPIQRRRHEMKTPLAFSFAETMGRVVDVLAALLFVGLMYFVATA
jgi:hypothetical protein